MQITIYDRVQETTSSSGTGSITLNGALSGFKSFESTVGIGNVTYYGIIDSVSNVWEIGIGTLTTSSVLTRSTILSSSNSGNHVSFPGNLSKVFIDVPAEKRVQVDSAIIGTASITSFYGDGSNLTGIESGSVPTLQQVTDSGNVSTDNVSFGNINASVETENIIGNASTSVFYGDGSNLSGISGETATIDQVTNAGNTTSNSVNFGNVNASSETENTIGTSGQTIFNGLFQTGSDPQTIIENSNGDVLVQSDGNGQFEIKNASGVSIFFVDSNQNPSMQSAAVGFDGSIIGFDSSSGNPRITNIEGAVLLSVDDNFNPVIKNSGNAEIFSCDGSGNPQVVNTAGTSIYQIDSESNPKIQNSGNGQIFGADENLNPFLASGSDSGSIGFDSSNNPSLKNASGGIILGCDDDSNPYLAPSAPGFDQASFSFTLSGNPQPQLINSNGDQVFGIDPDTGRPTISQDIWPESEQGSLLNDGDGNLTWGPPYRQINPQTGTTYTLQNSDQMVTLDNSSAITVTIPSGLNDLFECDLIQINTGQVTVVGDGVTILSYLNNSSLPGMGACASVKQITENNFVLVGNLS